MKQKKYNPEQLIPLSVLMRETSTSALSRQRAIKSSRALNAGRAYKRQGGRNENHQVNGEIAEKLNNEWDQDMMRVLKGGPLVGKRIRPILIRWRDYFKDQMNKVKRDSGAYEVLSKGVDYLEYLVNNDNPTLTLIFHVAIRDVNTYLLAVGEDMMEFFDVNKLRKNRQQTERTPLISPDDRSQQRLPSSQYSTPRQNVADTDRSQRPTFVTTTGGVPDVQYVQPDFAEADRSQSNIDRSVRNAKNSSSGMSNVFSSSLGSGSHGSFGSSAPKPQSSSAFSPAPALPSSGSGSSEFYGDAEDIKQIVQDVGIWLDRKKAEFENKSRSMDGIRDSVNNIADSLAEFKRKQDGWVKEAEKSKKFATQQLEYIRKIENEQGDSINWKDLKSVYFKSNANSFNMDILQSTLPAASDHDGQQVYESTASNGWTRNRGDLSREAEAIVEWETKNRSNKFKLAGTSLDASVFEVGDVERWVDKYVHNQMAHLYKDSNGDYKITSHQLREWQDFFQNLVQAIENARIKKEFEASQVEEVLEESDQLNEVKMQQIFNQLTAEIIRISGSLTTLEATYGKEFNENGFFGFNKSKAPIKDGEGRTVNINLRGVDSNRQSKVIGEIGKILNESLNQNNLKVKYEKHIEFLNRTFFGTRSKKRNKQLASLIGTLENLYARIVKNLQTVIRAIDGLHKRELMIIDVIRNRLNNPAEQVDFVRNFNPTGEYGDMTDESIFQSIIRYVAIKMSANYPEYGNWRILRSPTTYIAKPAKSVIKFQKTKRLALQYAYKMYIEDMKL